MFCEIRDRVERAKPSYLERIKEEQERLEKLKTGQAIDEDTKQEDGTSNREPLSGIADTIMIRKSKRKFFVVANKPVVINQVGDIISDNVVQTPETMNEENKGTTPISTKKYFSKLHIYDS